MVFYIQKHKIDCLLQYYRQINQKQSKQQMYCQFLRQQHTFQNQQTFIKKQNENQIYQKNQQFFYSDKNQYNVLLQNGQQQQFSLVSDSVINNKQIKVINHAYNEFADTLLLVLSDGYIQHYDFQEKTLSQSYDNCFGLQIIQIQSLCLIENNQKNQQKRVEAYLVLTEKEICLLTLSFQSKKIQPKKMQSQQEYHKLIQNQFCYEVQGKTLLDLVQFQNYQNSNQQQNDVTISKLKSLVSRKFLKSNKNIFTNQKSSSTPVSTIGNSIVNKTYVTNNTFVLSIYQDFVYLAKYSVIFYSNSIKNKSDEFFHKKEFKSLDQVDQIEPQNLKDYQIIFQTKNFKGYKILLSPLKLNQINKFTFKNHQQQSLKHIQTSILAFYSQQKYQTVNKNKQKNQINQKTLSSITPRLQSLKSFRFYFITCNLNEQFQQSNNDLKHRIFTLDLVQQQQVIQRQETSKIEQQKYNQPDTELQFNFKLSTKILANALIKKGQENIHQQVLNFNNYNKTNDENEILFQKQLYFLPKVNYLMLKSQNHVLKQYIQKVYKKSNSMMNINQSFFSQSALVYVFYQAKSILQIEILAKTFKNYQQKENAMNNQQEYQKYRNGQSRNLSQSQTVMKNLLRQSTYTYDFTLVKTIKIQGIILIDLLDISKLINRTNSQFIVALCYDNSIANSNIHKFSVYEKCQITLLNVDSSVENTNIKNVKSLCLHELEQDCSIFIHRQPKNQPLKISNLFQQNKNEYWFNKVSKNQNWTKINLIQKKVLYNKMLQQISKNNFHNNFGNISTQNQNLNEVAIQNILSLL